MAQDTPSRDLDKVIVRLPDGVRDMLKMHADENQRSMNAEIVARLLESLEPWKPGDEPALYKTTVSKKFGPTTFDLEDLMLRLRNVERAVAKKSGGEPD
jgi:plasmid stability protein